MQMMHSIYTNYDDCICCHHRHRRINQNNGLVESVFMITLFFYFNINSLWVIGWFADQVYVRKRTRCV